MLVTLATVIALAAAPPRSTTRPPGPVTLTRAEADSVLREIAKEREETRQWLKSSPTSYLATVQRVDYGSRDRLTVGREPGNSVILDDATVRPHHLRVTVVGDSFHVEALDDSARFKVKDRELREATLGPSSISVGRFILRLSHQRYPAIIVFDPQSPRLKTYRGIDYYPADLAWRFVLPLAPNTHPDTVVIVSTRGSLRRAVRVGWFDFAVGRAPCRLEADRLLEPGVGENDIAVFFRDLTSGKETYPVGRYLDPVALGDGRYLLDFNLAYNPACAYSEHYNCPIPPRHNRLNVAVRAGEKDPHHLDHLPPP
jgi:hypothetical protein